jgi:hypothetical protein
LFCFLAIMKKKKKKKKKRRRIRFGSTFSEFFFCWVPPSVLFSQAFFSLLSGCGN